MAPKLTRKYPTDQKTTTPDGYREYKKLQMRERRATQKSKPGLELKETLSSMYDRDIEKEKALQNAYPDEATANKILDASFQDMADAWWHIITLEKPDRADFKKTFGSWLHGVFAVANLSVPGKIAVSYAAHVNVARAFEVLAKENTIPEHQEPLEKLRAMTCEVVSQFEELARKLGVPLPSFNGGLA